MSSTISVDPPMMNKAVIDLLHSIGVEDENIALGRFRRLATLFSFIKIPGVDRAFNPICVFEPCASNSYRVNTHERSRYDRRTLQQTKVELASNDGLRPLSHRRVPGRALSPARTRYKVAQWERPIRSIYGEAPMQAFRRRSIKSSKISISRSRPISLIPEISRFNRSPSNSWFEISPEFLQLVIASRKIHGQTNGAFEPTPVRS